MDFIQEAAPGAQTGPKEGTGQVRSLARKHELGTWKDTVATEAGWKGSGERG